MKKLLFLLCVGGLFYSSVVVQAVDNDVLYREHRSDRAFQELDREFRPSSKKVGTSKSLFASGRILLKASLTTLMRRRPAFPP